MDVLTVCEAKDRLQKYDDRVFVCVRESRADVVRLLHSWVTRNVLIQQKMSLLRNKELERKKIKLIYTAWYTNKVTNSFGKHIVLSTLVSK